MCFPDGFLFFTLSHQIEKICNQEKSTERLCLTFFNMPLDLFFYGIEKLKKI